MDESNPSETPKADATTPDAGIPSQKPKLGELLVKSVGSLLTAAVLFSVDAIVGGNYMWSFLDRMPSENGSRILKLGPPPSAASRRARHKPASDLGVRGLERPSMRLP